MVSGSASNVRMRVCMLVIQKSHSATACLVRQATRRPVQSRSKWVSLLLVYQRRVHHENCAKERSRVSPEVAPRILLGDHTHTYIWVHTDLTVFITHSFILTCDVITLKFCLHQ